MSGWIYSSDMSQFESHENKVSGVENVYKTVLEERLREAGVRVARSVSIEEDTKICSEKEHNDPSNHQLPTETSGNYTVHGGAGLVLLDVDDDPDELPEEIADLPPTFVVESPHRGYHVYYVVEDDSGISDRDGVPWGSIRYGQYLVGPGSTIDHDRCDDGKANCPGEGVGEYDIAVDKPIATLSGDHIEHLREGCESNNNAGEELDLEAVENLDGSIAEKGQQALHNLLNESAWTFNAVMEFLQGGIPEGFEDDRLRKDGGSIDRSSTTYVGLSLLYSTVKYYVDDTEHDPHQITYQTFTHFCRERPKTQDGQKRRWLTDTEDWRLERLKHATANAHTDRFEGMVKHSGTGARSDNNEYSQLTYNAIWEALYELLPEYPPRMSNDMDPATSDGRIALRARYPGKDEVVDRAYEIDDGYNEWSSYEEAFRRLQSNYGEVKAARIGNDWVYYPAEYPDPPEANYVLQYGEDYDPEEEDGINSWTGDPEQTDTTKEASEESEQEVMTDGGVNMSKSERIHRSASQSG